MEAALRRLSPGKGFNIQDEEAGPMDGKQVLTELLEENNPLQLRGHSLDVTKRCGCCLSNDECSGGRSLLLCLLHPLA